MCKPRNWGSSLTLYPLLSFSVHHQVLLIFLSSWLLNLCKSVSAATTLVPTQTDILAWLTSSIFIHLLIGLPVSPCGPLPSILHTYSKSRGEPLSLLHGFYNNEHLLCCTLGSFWSTTHSPPAALALNLPDDSVVSHLRKWTPLFSLPGA